MFFKGIQKNKVPNQRKSTIFLRKSRIQKIYFPKLLSLKNSTFSLETTGIHTGCSQYQNINCAIRIPFSFTIHYIHYVELTNLFWFSWICSKWPSQFVSKSIQ